MSLFQCKTRINSQSYEVYQLSFPHFYLKLKRFEFIKNNFKKYETFSNTYTDMDTFSHCYIISITDTNCWTAGEHDLDNPCINTEQKQIVCKTIYKSELTDKKNIFKMNEKISLGIYLISLMDKKN